jgi:hypothetical protein
VIVHYFDVFGISFVPAKADAVPIVDPDAVPCDSIPLQRLQTVSRRSQEFAQFGREVQHPQSSPRRGFDVYETATRSLWNNRSLSGQRNDRITPSEYYALRKTYSFFLRPAPALIPAQFRRRETDIAIQNHL